MSKMKRSEKGLLTPDNCVVALIDHQPQMLFGVSNFDRQSIINNTVALAKAARVFDLPVVLSTVESKSFSGNIWPQIKAVFPNQVPIERTSMDAWDDKNFVAAIEKSGRKKIVLAGLVDRDLRHAADDSSHPRQLRSLCGRGLLRRRESTCARQCDEARGPGWSETGHLTSSDARMAARLGGDRHLRRRHGHREDSLRRIRSRCRVREHHGPRRDANKAPRVRNTVAGCCTQIMV